MEVVLVHWRILRGREDEFGAYRKPILPDVRGFLGETLCRAAEDDDETSIAFINIGRWERREDFYQQFDKSTPWASAATGAVRGRASPARMARFHHRRLRLTHYPGSSGLAPPAPSPALISCFPSRGSRVRVPSPAPRRLTHEETGPQPKPPRGGRRPPSAWPRARATNDTNTLSVRAPEDRPQHRERGPIQRDSGRRTTSASWKGRTPCAGRNVRSPATRRAPGWPRSPT